MSDKKDPPAEILKEAILELKEPVLFPGILNNAKYKDDWGTLEMNNFIKLIGDIPLSFRVGLNARIFEPQWDLDCPVKTMTISEFIEKSSKKDEISKNDDKWYYFDYKYMNVWFRNKPEILKAVNWNIFGFDKSGEDSTLWIGSEGAHTNCHQDSYGCNLIAQLHGKKQWLLFPPDSGNALKQTRVPYEESTVYSKFNFFCPSKDDEEEIIKINATPKLIALQPGDVLFVPKGWWHYVESLDTTCSINVWLPLDTDNEARLKEALVKFIMTRLGDGLPSAEADDQFESLQDSVLLIKECIKQCHQITEKQSEEIREKIIKKDWTLSKLVAEYPEVVEKLPNLNKEELKKLLTTNRERFSMENKDSCKTMKASASSSSHISFDTDILKSIVDTLCHSDVIDKIANVLINEN